jgi:hypothetical protein
MVTLTDALDYEIPSFKSRQNRTRWVSVIIESPIHSIGLPYHAYDRLFTYTADYLAESQFGINYESQKRFLWGLNVTFDDTHDYSQGKTGFMTALISNCDARHSRRAEYIRILKKHINITIHGGCGQACPGNIDCREFVGAKYKFYFAYENSFCRDYITEKFFLMLKYDIVVVVFGAGNYSKFVSVYVFVYFGYVCRENKGFEREEIVAFCFLFFS